MEIFEKETLVSAENVIAQDKTFPKAKSASISIAQFVVLLSVAIFAPALDIQSITGTLVNATLFVATALLGLQTAILIGIIPSVVSIVTGLLPVAILPMVPFIVFSNAVLIIIFSMFQKKSFVKGVVIASVLKFAFLSVVSSFVIHFFVSEKIASKIALMMSWPQLFTALSGGILAYFVLGAIKKIEK